MTTADRVDPVGYRSWAPPATLPEQGAYTGRHRGIGRRSWFAVRRMFYAARHRAR